MGVNVIREPDRGVVVHPSRFEAPFLRPGDEVLRYGFNGDGNFRYWSTKGTFELYFESATTHHGCGFADATQCPIEITRYGVNEWWLQVKTSHGRRGWMLGYKGRGGKYWHNPNFSEFCLLES